MTIRFTDNLRAREQEEADRRRRAEDDDRRRRDDDNRATQQLLQSSIDIASMSAIDTSSCSDGGASSVSGCE